MTILSGDSKYPLRDWDDQRNDSLRLKSNREWCLSAGGRVLPHAKSCAELWKKICRPGGAAGQIFLFLLFDHDYNYYNYTQSFERFSNDKYILN